MNDVTNNQPTIAEELINDDMPFDTTEGKFATEANDIRSRIKTERDALENPEPEIRADVIRTIDVKNTSADSKKPATVSVRLNMKRDDLIYTDRIKSKAVVVGYDNPVTGEFITEVVDPSVDENEIPNVYASFREYMVSRAQEYVLNYLSELGKLTVDQYEQQGLKPLSRLRKELIEYLEDRNDFFIDLQKQVNLIESRHLPRVNEYLLYQDDAMNYKRRVTARIPYANPRKQQVTDEQKQLVDKFLDTFFDEYNKKVVSWYFGAALSNVDIHDARVSKMLIVASERGGSGKSSVITGLTNALITPLFSTISPSFDRHFTSSSRFATSILEPKRMYVYSEADFADPNLMQDNDNKRHDFTGLDTSMIKSFITDGYIVNERKHKDEVIRKLHGLHIVLTNHPPVINDSTEALRRRLLPLVVKPTTMQDKARELGLWGQEIFNTFLVDNAQAFANYFVDVFKSDEYMFTEVDYDRDEFVDDIDESGVEVEAEVETQERQVIEAVKTVEITKELKAIATAVKLRPTRFLDAVNKAVLDSPDKPDSMRRDGEFLYIDSKKDEFLAFGKNALALRKELIKHYGQPVKKFGKRVFQIRINEHFQEEVED